MNDFRHDLFQKILHLYRSSKNYNSQEDLTKLKFSIRDASNSLQTIHRENGEPMLFHALQVAQICVSEIQLNATSIISILLHESWKHGGYDIRNIGNEYGAEVEKIVIGLNKISNLDTKADQEQAENFRQLVVSFATDPRVILIKLADRLDVMRHLYFFSPEKQLKKANETLFLYAPLAHKLGLYKLKSELEDLSLKYSKTDDYNKIVQDLEMSENSRKEYIEQFVKPLQNALANSDLDFEIKSRTKSIYSLWNKIKKNNINLDEIYDVFAVRIILKSDLKLEKADCWKAFSVVSEIYQCNPKRLKDWISVPKSNGYESLHTTVIGPEGKWVEVQIRTQRMDEIAENGIAAHWLYKGIQQQKGLDNWLTDLRDLLESTENPSEVVENLKLDLYQKEIFVFTPTGDLKKLPSGASVLDFAFEIHSNVGSKCIGGKVNSKMVSIREKLKNGDLVEIITAKNQKPVKDWLQFVITSKARNKIKQSLREEENELAKLGKETFERKLKNWKIKLSADETTVLLKKLKIDNLNQLFLLIANESLDTNRLKELIDSIVQIVENETIHKPVHEVKSESVEGAGALVIDDKLANVSYKLAKCCNPILGDEIFGFVSVQDGIKIHRVSCPNASQIHQMYPYRIVPVKWRESVDNSAFQCFIKITAENDLNIFNTVTQIINNELKLKIRSASFEIHGNHLEIFIKLFIQNTKVLDMLIHRILREKKVIKASRIES